MEQHRMRKYQNRKRMGRKARVKRALASKGLGALPPGLYTFQIAAARMVEASGKMGIALELVSKQLGKTLILTHQRLER